MKKLLLAATVLALFAVPAYAQQQDAKELVGTWKLTTLKTTGSDGKVTLPLGEKPEGFVTITPNRMWLMFIDGTRKAPVAPAATDAENVAMMKTNATWTGTYKANEQTPDGIKLAVKVDSSVNQVLANTDRIYFMKVSAGKLHVKSAPIVIPMTGATAVAEYDMVKAE
jgi:hypothetical protein